MLSCLDESGLPVDHWVALARNLDYNYYTHDEAEGFIRSDYDLNQTSLGSIMATVGQLYATNLDMNDIAYALYNDDPPPPEDTASSTYAHAKGVMLLNGEQGFWLIHSKPNWPGSRADGPIPFPDTQYSQSLMCITLDTPSFDSIAAAEMVNYPYIYDSYISSNLEDLVPNFSEWINGGKSDLTNVTNTISSKGGVVYTQFAKSKAWGKDLYEDFVAPTLSKNLNVETWRSGSGGRMGSFCDSGNDDTYLVHPTEYEVFEVSEVTMPDGANWAGTQDHSKWVSTVSTDNESSRYVCVGDINRMCSQESRGGGTVCVSNADTTLWESFDDAITGVESCWEYNPCDGSSSKCYWCPLPEPTFSPSHYPTSATTGPTIAPYSIVAGDIAITLFNSDNPDSFSIVSLHTLSIGTEIKFTDDAWNGTAFRGGEGIISYTTTSTVPAGYVWTYQGDTSADPYGSWASKSGYFSLSTDGDQIFVYTGDDEDPEFIFGLSTNQWITDGSKVSSTTSVCPTDLCGADFNTSIYFDSIDNGYYSGITTGTKIELLAYICDTENWIISDTENFPADSSDFTVLPGIY